MRFDFKIPLLAFVLLFGLQAKATAGIAGDSLPARPTFLALPIAFYQPETRWGFGLGAAYNFHPKSQSPENRPSQIQLGGVYTLERQWLFYLPFALFLNQDQYRIEGELGYYDYLYRFYGIGNETRAAGEEFFRAQFPRIRFSGSYAILPNLYIGLTYKYDRFSITEYKENGLLSASSSVSPQPTILSELGTQIIWDTRDYIFYPSGGHLASLEWSRRLPDGNESPPYSVLHLDYALYREIAPQHLIAGQIQWTYQQGQPPFFHLARLGGPKYLRGYIEGRFRSRRAALVQVEYRFPIFWRFRGACFLGYGGVDDVRAIPLQAGHWAGGAGLRFLIDQSRKLHLRLDVAFGKDQSGWYLTVGEAF